MSIDPTNRATNTNPLGTGNQARTDAAPKEDGAKMATDSFKRSVPITQDPQAIAEWQADAAKLGKKGTLEAGIGGTVAVLGAVVLGTAFIGGTMLLGPLTLIGGFLMLAGGGGAAARGVADIRKAARPLE
jgi:hypothetical protein